MRLEVYGNRLGQDPDIRSRVERRLGFALDRLGGRVTRVQVVLADLNGPRGGIDKRCLLVADLLRGGQLVIEQRADNWIGAVDGAAGRLAEAVRRRLAWQRRGRRRRGMPAEPRFEDSPTLSVEEV
jgi:hypothetical protein